MKKDDDDDYNKKIENGLKKKELEEKYGAHFSEFNESPPEIEGQWLNSIDEFEKQHSNANIWINRITKEQMN